jgi:hypothetical protein
LISLPAAAVIAGFFTLILAIRSDDGLVVDDYYRHGLQINRLLTRERAAADAALRMRVDIEAGSRSVLITLSAEPGFVFPDRLGGTITHATRVGLDVPIELVRVGDSSYRAEGVEVPPGQWYVDVGTRDWRLMQRLVTAAAP